MTRISTLLRSFQKQVLWVAGFSAMTSLALIGCDHASLLPPSSASASATFSLSGGVHGGQQPVTGSNIQLFAVAPAGSTASVLLNSQPVHTDANGAFSLTGLFACPSASSNVYLVATGGNPGLAGSQNNPALALMVALGHCGNLTPSTYISVNEVTTVAAVYALAPYMQSYSSVSSGATDSAFALASALADYSTGTTPGPAATGFNVPSVKVRALANILASCINSNGGPGACNQLFALTTDSGITTPAETIAAVLGIANHPAQNVAALYNLTAPIAPFQPTMFAAPADWSLPVTSLVPSLSIASVALPATATGTTYAAALQAQGGTPSYTWSLRSGSLPSGLSLTPATGVITGVPTSSGTFALTVQVADQSSPAQTATAPLAITVVPSAPPLIVSGALPAGTAGIAYAAGLNAAGGTPAYTWTIAGGALPAGLTLAGSTGIISGTPSVSGTFNFTLSATDNGSPIETAVSSISLAISPAAPVTTGGQTWYIRSDGGTRYSANVPQGQCDGLADGAYSGTGVNQHCAFNDFRYLWDDDSGQVGLGAWVIAGGDTVLVRGCSALANSSNRQSNPSGTNCRLGWDRPYGDSLNKWCYGVGSYTCNNPVIPAGTAARHTRILGQNYANCNAAGAGDPSSYVSNLTQLFAGFSLSYAINLKDTQYVDVQCIELTTHNGVCVSAGSPAYPRPCSNNQPLDDFAANGFVTSNKTSNISLQDVYVHGFNAAGFSGPIGGPITLTRVSSNFNASAGWNFDDGADTPDAAGSQILASFVTMKGNGCYEEYPVVHAFPAQACYDDASNGFGDAWSGQDTDLDTFICDHCIMAYNTKDAFIGPHTNVHTLTITNSQSYGNMGAQWKWDNTPNATVTFENNLTVGSCARFADTIPGAAHTYALSSGLPGAYLSDYCRAGGNTVAINSQQNSYVLFANNTFVDYINTVFLLSCGPQGHNQNQMCGTTPFVFTNNVFLSYHLQGSLPPGLFYINDSSITVTQSHNVEFGNRPNQYGETCSGNGNTCADPQLVGQPIQQNWTNQSFLDNFNFHPTPASPAVGAGVIYAQMMAKDFYGTNRPTPPSAGGVEQ